MKKTTRLFALILSSILLTASLPLASQTNISIDRFENIVSNQCPGIASPSIIIKNTGSDTLYSTLISWWVNDLEPDTFLWTGHLYPDSSSQEILLEEMLLYPYTNYNFRAKAIYTNGSIDISSTTRGKYISIKSCHDNDASISNIEESFWSCTGNNPLYVSLKNCGNNYLTNTIINFSIDNIAYPQIDWQGSLYKGHIEDSIYLGDFNLTNGFHDIQVWTSEPNGELDQFTNNDTLSLIDAQITYKTNYTVGSVNSDFQTIQEAADHLSSITICSPITVTIKDGIYEEQVTIRPVDGSSNINTVTYTSESENPLDVTIQFETNYTSRFLIWLDGAQNTIIENIRIKGLNYYLDEGIIVSHQASNNTFQNLLIENTDFTGTNPNGGKGIYINDTLCHNNKILGNTFLDFRYAILFEAFESASLTEGIDIIGNNLEGYLDASIILNHCKNPLIERNHLITSTQSYSTKSLIEINNASEGFRINNNTLNGDVCKLKVNNSKGSENNRAHIINNSLIGDEANSSLFVSEYINFYYNTIVNKEETNAGILLFDDAHHLDLVNNIIQDKSAGYRLLNFYSNNTTFDRCDYNVYFNNGNFANYSPNHTSINFNFWKDYTNLDAHSIFYEPEFITENNCHIKLTTNNYQINGFGIPTSGVLKDIDNQLRDTNHPDPGADEFTEPLFDVGILPQAINQSYCSGISEVKIHLKNYGISKVDTVFLKWSINNNAQTPMQWTGSLESGEESSSFSIGNYYFQSDSIYQIDICIDSISNGNDSLTDNNALSFFIQSGAMSGSYTIGGLDDDFLTIQGAIDTLVSKGLCDQVVFTLKDTIFYENVIIPNIPGSSENKRLYIKSNSLDSSLCRIYNESAYPITISNTKHITIKSIGFWGYGIYGEGGNHDIEISNCWFEGSNSQSKAIIFNESLDQAIKIDFNYIHNCKEGIEFKSSTGIIEIGNRINNNLIENTKSSISLNLQNSIVIQDNIIWYQNPQLPEAYYGIKLTFCSKDIIIKANQIYLNQGHGIDFQYCGYQNSEDFWITNNMVSTQDYAGISFLDCRNLSIINNTFNCHTASAIALFNQSSGLKFQNNILSNYGTGGIFYIDKSSIAYCDYNNVFTEGDYFYQRRSAGQEWKHFYNIEDWQDSTSFDLHSVMEYPSYINDSTDLHIGNSSQSFRTGLMDSLVTYDIDNEIRNNPPCIGADAFIQPQFNNDIAMEMVYQPDLCEGLNEVSIRIKNTGSHTIDSVSISWQVNNMLQDQHTWRGSLDSSYTTDIVIGSYNMSPTATLDIKAWVETNNGTNDENPINDTSFINSIYPQFSGEYSIGGYSDFPTILEAMSVLQTNGICGPVVFNISEGTYYGSSFDGLQIDSIYGIDSINTVSFRSDPTNTINAVIESEITINNTDYITFENITFHKLSYRTSIISLNYSNHCTFINNTFLSLGSNSTHSNITTDHSNFTNIYKNTFEETNGFTIKLKSQSPDLAYGNKITDNYMINSKRNIYCDTQHDLMISNNTIISNKDNFQSNYGIYLINLKGNFLIQGNKIHGNFGTLLYLNSYYPSQTSSHRGQISNNELFQNYNSHAIQISSSRKLDIINNSCLLYNNNPISKNNLNLSTVSKINIQNNILANFNNGYAINYNTIYDSIDVNYNNYYTSGSAPISYSGLEQSISDMQTLLGLDSNSVEINPDFYSNTRLVPLNPLLDSLGKYDPLVIVDIDSTQRSLSFPDIGAYEFTVRHIDIGIDISESLTSFCDGEDSLYVNIYNYGIDTIQNIELGWSISGVVQDTSVWSGELARLDSISEVFITAYQFPPGLEYDLKFWISSVNGYEDQVHFNDTLSINNYSKALAGIYTIGTLDSDFLTITNAVDALTNGGVCDSVIFKIEPGTYNEQIYIPEINGTSEDHYIVFESITQNAEDVMLIFSASVDSNYTLSISGADYINFKHLTVSTDPSIASSAIVIEQESRHLNFEHNIFIGDQVYSHPKKATISSLGSKDDYLIFYNNSFYDGSIALDLNGEHSQHEKGIYINSNDFINQKSTAISISYADSIIISSNTITSVQDSISDYYIELENIENSLVLTKNTIDLELGNGIRAWDISNLLTYGDIVNNMITIRAGEEAVIGMYLSRSSCNVYNNSVNVGNTNENSVCLEIGIQHQRIFNNSLANLGGGLAIKMQNDPYLDFIDYNNLYTTGPVLGRCGSSFNYGTPLADLSAFEMFTNYENSISVNPLYISENNLHIYNNSPLINFGTLNSYVNIFTDFDDEIRDSIFDIGADEFDITQLNAYISELSYSPPNCVGYHDLTASIYNSGATTITSCLLHWSINGIESDSVITINSIFNPGDTIVDILLDSCFFESEVYDLDSWITYPNDSSGVIDSVSTIHFIIYQNPNLFIGNDTSICNNANYLLQSNMYFSSYEWFFEDELLPFSTEQQLFIDVEGTYSLNITDMNGCKASDTIQILFDPELEFELPTDSAYLCLGGTNYYEIQDDENLDFVWTNTDADTLSLNHIFPIDTFGVFILNVSNICNLTLKDTLFVSQASPAELDLGEDRYVDEGAFSIQIIGTPEPFYEFLWNGGSTSPGLQIFTINMEEGEYLYWLEVIDTNGCTARDTITIHIAGSSSVENNKDKYLIETYPNPTSGLLNILAKGAIRIELYNSLGQILNQYKYNGELITIDLIDQPKGTYHLKCIFKDGEIVRKIVLN